MDLGQSGVRKDGSLCLVHQELTAHQSTYAMSGWKVAGEETVVSPLNSFSFRRISSWTNL